MRSYLLFFAIVGCLGNVFGQSQWNLSQCLDSGVYNNLGLELIKLNTAAADINATQALYNFAPTLSGYASHSYYFGRNLDPVSNEFTQSTRQNSGFSLSGNLTLFDGMSRYYGMKKSQLAVENEIFNKIVAVRNLKLLILTNYLQALLSHEILRLSRDHIHYTNAEYKRMELLIEAEVKVNKELIPIEAQRARDELAVLKAQNDFNWATLQLRQLIQLSDQTNFQIDTSVQFILEDSAIYIEIENLPEIQQKEVARLNAEYDVKLAKSAYFPSLALRGNLGSNFSDSYFISDPTTGTLYVPNFQTQLSENLYQGITFSLSVPIYNQNITRTNQQLKALEVERVELERQQLILEFKTKIAELQRDIENASAELNAALKLVDLATLDFQQAKEQYDAGVINYSILSNKQDLLFTAQSNVVQSKYNYYFKRKILQIYYE